MKWVKRGLWLSIWLLWTWLGVRLVAELPRDPGIPLCQVGDDGEECLGFLPGVEAVVTRRIKAGAATYRRWDARTGAVSSADDAAIRDAERLATTLPVLCPRGEPPIAFVFPTTGWDIDLSEGYTAPPYQSDRRQLVGSPRGAIAAAVTPIPNKHVGSDRSAVTEMWEFAAGAHRWEPITCAVRGRDDDRLCWRTWTALPERISSDGVLWLTSDFNIFTVPSPNWPLLALCQSILALPLILLWAMLRWRRKRRMPGTTS